MICKNIHNDRSSAVQHMRQYQKDISLEHRLMIEMRLTLPPMVYAGMKCIFISLLTIFNSCSSQRDGGYDGLSCTY